MEEQATTVLPSFDLDAGCHVRADDVEGFDCLDEQRKPDRGGFEASFVADFRASSLRCKLATFVIVLFYWIFFV